MSFKNWKVCPNELNRRDHHLWQWILQGAEEENNGMDPQVLFCTDCAQMLTLKMVSV